MNRYMHVNGSFFKNVVSAIKDETNRIRRVIREESIDDNIVEPPKR